MVIEAKTSVKKKGQTAQQAKPSPISNIQKIGSLKRYSDQEYANTLLHDVVKLVAPIIHENNFKVGTLCEMFPKNPNLLGLNVNRGQKILIRLRYHSNERSFYPMGDIIGTFLHELTHNIYGPHDNKFYKFLDKLQERFEQIQVGGVLTGYFCEEQRLGRKFNENGLISIREKRLQVLGRGIYKAESRRLGTNLINGENNIMPRDMKKAILAAAERRLKDSKWCSSKMDRSSVEPFDNEIEIIELDFDDPAIQVNNKEIISGEYREVVNLTNEEYPEIPATCDEIIVIDGCEKDESTLSGDNVKISCKKNVRFIGLSPSLDDDKTGFSHLEDAGDSNEDVREEAVHYRGSLSPGRAFIQNEELYPRRKLVADLNFSQILRKGSTIHIEEINTVKNAEVAQNSSNIEALTTDTSIIQGQNTNKSVTVPKKYGSKPKQKSKPNLKAKSKKRKMKSSDRNVNINTAEVQKPKKHVKSISFEDLL